MRRPGKSRCLLGLLVMAALGAGLPSSSAPDFGYAQMFQTENRSVADWCTRAPSVLPSELAGGSFVIPTLGQFEMGGQKLRGLFDAFGKFHRFGFGPDRRTVCFSCRMMETGFRNQSVALGRVAAGNLFYRTVPPRNYTGMQNIQGPNDNVFVNTYRMDDVYRSITDSQVGLEFDPRTLRILKNISWDDRLDKPPAPITYNSGSAHPLVHTASGCLMNVHPSDIMFTGWLPKVTLFKICPGDPNKRIPVNHFRPPTGQLPYFHSWGLSQKFAVFPHQPFSLNPMKMVKGGTIVDAFESNDKQKANASVWMVPLDGSRAFKMIAPQGIFFSHTLNTYDTEDSVVMDIVLFGANAFVQASDVFFYRNKTARDSMPKDLRGLVTRMELKISGPDRGRVTLDPLSSQEQATDFPTINSEYAGRQYCIYYANEWFHDGKTYASMAVVKHNICTGERSYWYKPSHYPSEPKFVDSASSHVEDQGTLIFAARDGRSSSTSLIVLDAATMEEISAVPVPVPLGFTTHGEFYPNL